jgi:hypothetical protein
MALARLVNTALAQPAQIVAPAPAEIARRERERTLDGPVL